MAKVMRQFLYRLQVRWGLIRRHGAELNKRVEIENELFRMAQGKQPLPTKQECRVLALKLGTPKRLWREEWKK